MPTRKMQNFANSIIALVKAWPLGSEMLLVHHGQKKQVEKKGHVNCKIIYVKNYVRNRLVSSTIIFQNCNLPGVSRITRCLRDLLGQKKIFKNGPSLNKNNMLKCCEIHEELILYRLYGPIFWE